MPKDRDNLNFMKYTIGNSEKPENDTELKILKISKNSHKPSPLQGLEHFFNVTPCDKKCNFFIFNRIYSKNITTDWKQLKLKSTKILTTIEYNPLI